MCSTNSQAKKHKKEQTLGTLSISLDTLGISQNRKKKIYELSENIKREHNIYTNKKFITNIPSSLSLNSIDDNGLKSLPIPTRLIDGWIV